MTRAARYLDRLYREYPAVWRRERDRADKLGIPLLTVIEAKANHWELMLKLHEPQEGDGDEHGKAKSEDTARV